MESHTKKYSQFICSIRWFGNGPSVSDETVAAGTSEPLTGASSKVGGNYMAGISFRCCKLRIRHVWQLGGNYMAEIYFAIVLNSHPSSCECCITRGPCRSQEMVVTRYFVLLHTVQ